MIRKLAIAALIAAFASATTPGMRTIEMEGTTQTIGNASTSFVAGK
jgi:hypothetical protein